MKTLSFQVNVFYLSVQIEVVQPIIELKLLLFIENRGGVRSQSSYVHEATEEVIIDEEVIRRHQRHSIGYRSWDGVCRL